MSLASSPSRRAARHGQPASTPAGGHGMCQNATIVLAGRRRTQHPGGEREVVVLDEHQRRGALRFVGDRRGETRIGAVVHAEVARSEHRRHANRVAQRPQALIGEPVVVPAVLVVRQPDIPQAVAGIGGWHTEAVTMVGAAASVQSRPHVPPMFPNSSIRAARVR